MASSFSFDAKAAEVTQDQSALADYYSYRNSFTHTVQQEQAINQNKLVKEAESSAAKLQAIEPASGKTDFSKAINLKGVDDTSTIGFDDSGDFIMAK